MQKSDLAFQLMFHLLFCCVSLIPSPVHATDPTRMELVIPGEQYFYLKAGCAAERQKWLVALGSSKACLGDSRSQKERGWFALTPEYEKHELWVEIIVGRAGEV